MRSSLFNLYAERAGRLSWTNTLPVWKIKKLEKNDEERKGQKSGWVTQCIMTRILRNRSWKPSECNRSRNFYQLLTVDWNYEWFQWVSPRVHSGARVRRKASELLCLSQLPPPHVIHFPLRGPILHISRYISSQTNDPINYLAFRGLTSETSKWANAEGDVGVHVQSRVRRCQKTQY